MNPSDQHVEKLKKLISTGKRIHLGFLIEYGYYNWIEDIQELIRKKRPISFRFTYENWYSKTLVLLENLQPTCTDKFILLYKNEKLKESVFSEYAIWDFMIGNEIHRSHDYTLKIKAVKHNFELQIELLESLIKKVNNSDIKPGQLI